ncbi:mRNA interferase HicA [Phytomonospora endophytica]|uniref:mRNA interferase HicA n=1 Tax=Phytomonospora endophytica TaxID=714109 RepID=A0A841FU97_9ACTN|nr:mRNA interferase HicA [Phytomonospora endophytica]GIG71161.1 hypothetical protein Pen01_74560 [Phytomonospora endophytica]
MKLDKLIRTLRKIAKSHGAELVLVRHGASHDVVRLGTVQFTIPRHREINERTAKAIIRIAEGACR